jgi:hypothetical protein
MTDFFPRYPDAAAFVGEAEDGQTPSVRSVTGIAARTT